MYLLLKTAELGTTVIIRGAFILNGAPVLRTRQKD